MLQRNSGLLGSIPPVTLNLIIINALCLLASFVLSTKGINLNDYLGLHYMSATKFNIAQFITYMFMHASFTHFFFNMFSLFMFGRTLEQVWGGKRFLIYYIVTGVGAAIVQEGVWWYELHDMLSRYETFQVSATTVLSKVQFTNLFVTIGASGSVFGILLAFGMMFPNAELFMMFIPVPIKAKYLVIGYGVLELFLGVSSYGGTSNVAHFAHLGGMLFGYILIKIWNKNKFNDGKYFY